MTKKAKKAAPKKLTREQRHAIAQASRKRNPADPNQRTYYPKYYFAYGSNMNLDQMKHRCKTARKIAAASLEGWKLVFRGVADIVPGDIDDIVNGALFLIQAEDERALDVYEGFPHLYIKKSVKVRTRDGYVEAMVYVMKDHDNRRDIHPPTNWYFEGIIDGYKHWNLPRTLLHEAHKMSIHIQEWRNSFEQDIDFKLEEEPSMFDQIVDYIERKTRDKEERSELVDWACNLNKY
jgi:gamma-glutamylcyclotransferase (GGCT)/AIG2-like uncharacterized protein YtfP